LPNRFANVPIDSDTTIVSQNQITVQGISALHQHWRWDGVCAESLIFVAEDIALLSPEELKAMLRKAGLLQLDQSITTSNYRFQPSLSLQPLKRVKLQPMPCTIPRAKHSITATLRPPFKNIFNYRKFFQQQLAIEGTR
jgi:hypothetical protein